MLSMRHAWWFHALVAVALLIVGPCGAAAASLKARLVVTVDLSQQVMDVASGGRHAYTWAVSTARRGYRTPEGQFHPIRLERSWYSRKYDNAPMPHAIFFLGGYAIHGTTEIRNLGRAVSHGCVRLHPANARTLFSLAAARDMSRTLIRIVP